MAMRACVGVGFYISLEGWDVVCAVWVRWGVVCGVYVDGRARHCATRDDGARDEGGRARGDDVD